MARAKGVSSKRILYTHALRNALIPLVTVIVPMMASILTGTLTIENIFGVPGLEINLYVLLPQTIFH